MDEESSSMSICVSSRSTDRGRGSLPTTRGVAPLSGGDSSSSLSSSAGVTIGVARLIPDREAGDTLERLFAGRLGVTGIGSVDLDRLVIDFRDAADSASTRLGMGVCCGTLPGDMRFWANGCGGVRFITVDLAKTVSRTMLAPSFKIDSSSGTLCCSSRMGETVPTTLLPFSTERTSSSRSGLSSSSSALSAPGSACDEPRFLLPRRGVTVSSRCVLLRFTALLPWMDALRCRCAEPFVARGVL